MQDPITYYELQYSLNGHIPKKFITVNKSEADVKTLEVMQEADQVELEYRKLKTSRAFFMAELKKLTGCKE
jgi:hypothetical protein